VRFDGRYGSAEHQRQRYRCIPGNGDRAHRFTELLPREESWNDACESCERDVGLHEGPHAARNYQFVARGIAEALVMVGAGSTYREAALVSRERAKRLRVGPGGEPRFSRHGSLVMDWVEVFAPVVFEPYRPCAWPAAGSLLLDELPFRVRDPQTGRHRIAFRIFAAMGYEAGRAKLWRLEAFTTSPRLTGKRSSALWTGRRRGSCVRQRRRPHERRACSLPDAELHMCEWHLRHALERLMAKLRTEQPEHRNAIDVLLADVEAAFTGLSFWTPFIERCHAAGITSLSDWLNSTGQIVADQFRQREPRWKRPADTPLSTSPLDGFINPIRASIKPRAYGPKNRERTNRMLMLMQLHANRKDDQNAYVRHIRECLETNAGHPSITRRGSLIPAALRHCDNGRPTRSIASRGAFSNQNAPEDASGGRPLDPAFSGD
jgi:hypothetical protein